MSSLILLYIGQASQEPSIFSTLILIPIMIFFMYFIVIRPQRREEKKRKEMLSSLSKGDKIVTTSGIHGKIVEIKEDGNITVVNIAKDINVSFSTNAIIQKKEK